MSRKFDFFSLFIGLFMLTIVLGVVILFWKIFEYKEQELTTWNNNNTMVKVESGKYSYTHFTKEATIVISDDKKCITFINENNNNIMYCGQFQIERYK